MRTPVATYRLQFHQGFRFVDGRDLVPYLHELGVSDMYSSPWFKARRGSSHGYDIADPLRVNSELGAEDDFEEMAARLRHYDMGLLLDVVPNHMAASSENPWWMDVLENGSSSEYAAFFDIDWHPAASKAAFLQDGRVLLPILGDLYGNVLENQELSLRVDDAGLFVRYYETRLPVDPKTYSEVLRRALENHPDAEALAPVLEQVEALPDRNDTEPASIATRHSRKQALKHALWQAYHTDPAARQAIDETLREFNGTAGDPAAFDAFDRLLSLQPYRLAHWKLASEEINYRRFFDVNELVGLRVEVPEVFALRHLKMLDMVRAGKVAGLRIDHVDGLYDPLGYLRCLQEAIGEPGGFYVVVEKILGDGERLRRDWPIAGTTGYEFLNALNGVFVHPQGLEALTELWVRRTGMNQPFADVSYAANKQVMQELFLGEVNALGHELGRLAASDREARDVPTSELRNALVEVTAWLPVYRTYIRQAPVEGTCREYIERTVRTARERTSPERAAPAAFDFLRRVLLLEPPHYAAEHLPHWLAFVMRWQQFTGPVMAKGLEDTASYRYHSLISLNEVGSDPLREQPPSDLARFHAHNRERAEHWAGTLNATSTHDTKRGEDARARINVLSELPREWEESFDCWSSLNAPLRRNLGGRTVPEPAEEFLIYQMLLSTWPRDEAEFVAYPERLQQFLVKASREAKLHTSWIRPDTQYEEALGGFAADILDPAGKFLERFLPLQRKLAYYGAVNGLAQALIKIAAPGVPDFFQGSELWNLSMVDPDNRRPVDYRKRGEMLDDLKRRDSEDRNALVAALGADPEQDAAKLFVVWKALAFRRANEDLFARGGYVALECSGARASNVIAFARRLEDRWAAVVAPRWLTQLGCRPPDFASCDWAGTELALPAGAPSAWRNVFSGAAVEGTEIAAILRGLPVALLEAA